MFNQYVDKEVVTVSALHRAVNGSHPHIGHLTCLALPLGLVKRGHVEPTFHLFEDVETTAERDFPSVVGCDEAVMMLL